VTNPTSILNLLNVGLKIYCTEFLNGQNWWFPHFAELALGSIPMLLHHGFVLYGILSIWYCDRYWVVLAYFSLLEISTPVVNARWFLFTCGLKESTVYAMNGVLLWLVFGLCRMPFVLFGPYLIYVNHTRMFEHSVYFATLLYIQIININLLNVYWFSLMTKKIVHTASSMLKATKKQD